MPLDYIAAALLYLLWRHRSTGNGDFLASNKLREELIAGKAGPPIEANDLRRTRVKRTLARLEKGGFLVGRNLPKSSSSPGPAPKGYQFSADPPIITKRVTAALVMRLKNHTEQRVAKLKLIEELLASGWGHTSSSGPLSAQECEDQVAYCLRKGYFIEADVADEVSGNTEKLLQVSAKVDECSLFLEKLATEVKMAVASEIVSSGQADARIPKVG